MFNRTTWTGQASGDWTDAANWTAGVPGAGDTAVIDHGAPALLASGAGALTDLLGVTILAANYGGSPTQITLDRVTLDTGSTLLFPAGSGSVSLDIPSRLDIGSGASLRALSDGTLAIDAGTTLANAETIEVRSGVLAFGSGALANYGTITLDQSGTLDIRLGALANTGWISIDGGAALLASVGFANAGMISVADGSLDLGAGILDAGFGGIIALGDGAEVTVEGLVRNQAFTFTNAGGATLTILPTDTRSGSVFDASSIVTGLIVGETLDLAGISFTGSRTTARYIGGRLAVSNGVQAIAIPLATPNLFYSSSSFILGAALDGGTAVTTTLPCFARGTRIATAQGDVPVEALAIGMAVRLARGGTRPIRWLGRRRVELRRHARPDLAVPIRIRRGALAPNVPTRDLLVSPDHALWLGGALIPARFLVNGATILPDRCRAEVEYFHVELDQHDLVLAEGAAAESYLDTGNRGSFETAAPRWRPPAPPCAPALTEGDALVRVRRALLERAEALGHRLSRDADLHMRAGRRRIAAARDTTGVFHVSGRGDLRIVSRSGIPAEVDPASTDGRTLGVALGAIVLLGPDGERDVLTHPDLARGFHSVERHGTGCWRWTTGEAILPSTVLAGVARVNLRVVATQANWSDTPVGSVAA